MDIKRLNKALKYNLLLIAALSFGSCNLFFSSPHGRENLNDAAAQITAFTAVPLSDNSVVTMWNWKEPPSWANDDRITHIKIQHSIFGYPENVSFIGIDTKEYTDNTIWQDEWPDLLPGITHYFSLFAMSSDHDNNDTWYAPIKTKIKLQEVVEIFGKNYSVTKSISIDNGGGVIIDSASLDIKNSSVAVFEFDFDNSYIVQAIISFTVMTTPTPGGDIEIVPLTGYLPTDNMEKWNFLDNNSLVETSLSKIITVSTSGNKTLDISDIVRFSPVNPVKALLIRTTDGIANLTLDSNASAPYIIADIVE